MKKNDIIIMILMLPMIGSLLQIFIGQKFITTDFTGFWGNIFSVLYAVSILLFCIYLINKTPQNKIRYKIEKDKQSKVMRILGLIFIPFVLWVTTYAGIFEYTASIYTKNTGKPYKSYILVESEDDIKTGGKICSGRYKIKSVQLKNNSLFNPFCLHRDNRNLLSPPTIINVEGKQSIFGYTVDFYEVETKNFSKTEYLNLRKDAFEFWK